MLINSEGGAQLEWENVTTDKMFEMVCGAVKKTIEERPLDKVRSDKPTAAALPVAIGISSLAANDTTAPEYVPTPVGNELDDLS